MLSRRVHRRDRSAACAQGLEDKVVPPNQVRETDPSLFECFPCVCPEPVLAK